MQTVLQPQLKSHHVEQSGQLYPHFLVLTFSGGRNFLRSRSPVSISSRTCSTGAPSLSAISRRIDSFTTLLLISEGSSKSLINPFRVSLVIAIPPYHGKSNVRYKF